MGMAICHTCKGPVHDNPDTPCNPFRIREQMDRLRAENADLLAALHGLLARPNDPAAWAEADRAVARAEGRSNG